MPIFDKTMNIKLETSIQLESKKEEIVILLGFTPFSQKGKQCPTTIVLARLFPVYLYPRGLAACGCCLN